MHSLFTPIPFLSPCHSFIYYLSYIPFASSFFICHVLSLFCTSNPFLLSFILSLSLSRAFELFFYPSLYLSLLHIFLYSYSLSLFHSLFFYTCASFCNSYFKGMFIFLAEISPYSLYSIITPPLQLTFTQSSNSFF